MGRKHSVHETGESGKNIRYVVDGCFHTHRRRSHANDLPGGQATKASPGRRWQFDGGARNLNSAMAPVSDSGTLQIPEAVQQHTPVASRVLCMPGRLRVNLWIRPQSGNLWEPDSARHCAPTLFRQ